MNEIKAISASNTSALPWTKKDCTQERLQEKVLEKFQLIVREAEERKSNCKSDTKLLYSGFWYANDYYKAVSKYRSLVGPLKENGSFYHGRSPSGFLPISDELEPGGKRISAYTLGKKVTPSEALKSIRTSVCFIDCQEAIQFAYYETLLEVWGEKVFNRRFGAKSAMPLCLDADTTRNSSWFIAVI